MSNIVIVSQVPLTGPTLWPLVLGSDLPWAFIKLWAAGSQQSGWAVCLKCLPKGRQGLPWVDNHGPISWEKFSRSPASPAAGERVLSAKTSAPGSAPAHHEWLPQSQPWAQAVVQRNWCPRWPSVRPPRETARGWG